jgi:hypothetical protein
VIGRPVRFLALVLGGWTGMRGWLLWPTLETVPDVARALIPPAAAALARPSPPVVQAVPSPVLAVQEFAPSSRAERAMASTVAVDTGAASIGVVVPPPLVAQDIPPPTVPQPALVRPPLPVSSPSRLSASAWLIARPGGAAVPFAGQLGGSQAGVRVLYALGAARRLSLAGRISTPLGRGQREAAIGFDWRPFDAPVHLFAEQRFALGKGRGGPTAGVIAGLDPTPVGLGLRLEGYGQAGVIARHGAEGFADGALRLGRPVARVADVSLDLGVGAWGGVQRGVRRLDLGPAVTFAVPLGKRPLRLSVEWRQRVAGNARPGSGPALTLGRDF